MLVVWAMLTILVCRPRRISMVVADGLAPIWRPDACNQHDYIAWRRYQMETFSASLAFCAGNSLITGDFPAQRPVIRSFDAFFDLCLNKRLSKQTWGWWFEMQSRSLWHHCNGMICSFDNDWIKVILYFAKCTGVTWLMGHFIACKKLQCITCGWKWRLTNRGWAKILIII